MHKDRQTLTLPPAWQERRDEGFPRPELFWWAGFFIVWSFFEGVFSSTKLWFPSKEGPRRVVQFFFFFACFPSDPGFSLNGWTPTGKEWLKGYISNWKFLLHRGMNFVLVFKTSKKFSPVSYRFYGIFLKILKNVFSQPTFCSRKWLSIELGSSNTFHSFYLVFVILMVSYYACQLRFTCQGLSNQTRV